MTNCEALKQLYVKMGGDADDIASENTILGVLNAISLLLDGSGDAEQNAEAIAEIASVSEV